MLLAVKTGGGLPYARKEAYDYDGKHYEADLQHGDIVTILDTGEVEQGNYGEQTVFKIRTRNGDKKMPFNQKTINVFVHDFGQDTANWFNKSVKVLLLKGIFGGKKGIAAYLVTGGWKLDEYGELVKDENVSSPEQKPEVTIDQIDF